MTPGPRNETRAPRQTRRARRAALPTGTVTFLFTDVEGSTALLNAHPDAYRGAVRRHHDLLQQSVEDAGGVVFETVGDAVYAAFSVPTDAVRAALAGQLALGREAWDYTPIRVRMGLHLGQVEVQGEHYFGAPLYRCARLMSTAHGGQVVLSGAVAELVADALPARATLKDLGQHRLKDLDRPEHVWQLDHPDLPAHFPPLESLSAVRHNLPVAPNSFVGRQQEVADLKDRLAATRLVTLSGIGGSGKTRLALAVATEVVDWSEFLDGVWLAQLAPIGDPLLVPGVVAASLGVKEQPGRPIRDTLLEEIRSRSQLLLLDNCEHLVEACAALADYLLQNCPGLRILATSREPLRISAEEVWRVPPLAAPDARVTVGVDELAKNAAVQLFVQRAQAFQSTLTLTTETAPAIAGICARLDGLPLAIELAAARVRVLTPDQILLRLDDAFRLLVGGSRAAPTRQQTLRAALDWSYVALSSTEQQCLERLSVFAGGFDLDGVEAIWSGSYSESGADALNLLTGLVDRSLVTAQPQAGGMRYRMLEPVRQYAQERLTERGGWHTARRQHADHVLRLTEQGEEGLKGAHAEQWKARLELEHDNVRAVLRRCLDAGEPGTVLRIGWALRNFWQQFGYRNEARRWLESALALGSDIPPTVRANALHTTAELAFTVGDFPEAQAWFEEAAEHWRSLGDGAGLGAALTFYGRTVAVTAQTPAEYAQGKALMQEAIALTRQTGTLWWAAMAMLFLGQSEWEHAELVLASATLGEAEAILTELGNSHTHSHLIVILGGVLRDQGDLVEGQRLLEQSLAESRAVKCLASTAEALYYLAGLNRLRGDPVVAAQQAVECLVLAHQVSHAAPLVNCIELLGGLACEQDQPERTATFFSSAAAFRQNKGVPMPPILRPAYERDLARAHGAIGSTRFAAAWAEGSKMTVDQLVAAVHQADPPPADETRR